MKICFVAQNIYPHLSREGAIEARGGAELQQKYIGRSLRDKGFDVSYISMDYGQSDEEVIDHFTIYKTFKPKEGIFGVRFFYPRLYKIWKALKRSDADVYYVRCATFQTAILAAFCRIYKKKFIFAGAHDTDFIPNRIILPTYRDKILYKFGLCRADFIVVQSHEQKRLLWEYFHLKCKVIPNFYPVKEMLLPACDRKIILWVSTLRPWKRPLQFIKLAESFPDEEFVMIGGKSPIPNEKNLFDTVLKRAQQVKNLQFLGFQPLRVTETYFEKCKVFVNTSEYEGFPNTFLQAWAKGIPVISYFDPDNVIKEHKLGFVVDSYLHLRTAMTEFLSNSALSGDHILNYFSRNYSYKLADQYTSLLNELQ